MRTFSTALKVFFTYTVITILCTTNVFAQEQPGIEPIDTLYRIETNDGNVFIGKIIDMDKNKVVLEGEAIGTITLHRKFIIKIERILGQDVTRGDVWYRNIQSARYYFSPNGYGLKKGESYYQNIWVFYNQFSVGLTDHFSLGFGMIPLFLFNGTATPVWITPKFSVPIVKEKVNIGVGALMGFVVGESTGFGITYATATFGPHDKNLSVGLGYAYAGGEFLNTPILNVGGLTRVSKNSYLMMETYFITDGGQVGGISILGARSMINKSAIDYGLAIPFAPGMGTFIALPWLGLTVPFQKKQ